MITYIINVAFRGAALIRGRCLFWSRCVKVQRSLQGGIYLRLLEKIRLIDCLIRVEGIYLLNNDLC